MSLLTKKRKEAGLSMTECAQRAGMDLSKLSRLEHGHLKLKVNDVLILSRAIGCQPSELIPALDDETDPDALTAVATAEEGTP